MAILSSIFFIACFTLRFQMFNNHIKCGFYKIKFHDLLYLIFNMKISSKYWSYEHFIMFIPVRDF
jgi:hypothetical protein